MFNYNNFITEKLGVNDDVIILSDYILNKINNKEDITLTNIPDNLSFKINEIIIKFIDSSKYGGWFNSSRSKLTKNGFNLYLSLNKNDNDLKKILYHELTHVIKFMNLTTKKLKMTSPINYYFDKRFNNLLQMLYYSDESEINAKIADIFSEIEDSINPKYSKKLQFSLIMKEMTLPKTLINYDIFDDLKDISKKDKIKFFQYITKIKNIKKDYNNKFLQLTQLIKYEIFNSEDINLNKVMSSTQYFINNQGKKLERKMHELYDLIV